MTDYCAFSKDHKCIKFADYELTRHELEEADELCHGNWIEIQHLRDSIARLQSLLTEHLLSMELLYTAITRAQKKVTIFLQEDIGTLSSLGHIEKSAVRRINSSMFKFVPLPEELLYIQNWYADEKKLATLSEYFVRSKSEVIIANMLVQEEVPFVYEEPLFAPDGTMFLPDFTVKFRGEIYYWEHVGRMDLPDYRAHWEIKEKWYEKHFPGKLLTTFEGKDLSTDAMGIIKDHK